MNVLNVNLYNETSMNKKNKEYYSYSQINTFLNCPQKYKLIYIDNIKTQRESVEGFIGKIVHEVLEWIYKQKIEYLIWDKIEEKYFEIWLDRWHNKIFYFNKKMLFEKNRVNKNKYRKFNQSYFKKIGLEYLRNYYRINGGPNLNYNSTIDTELELYTSINNNTFKVIIDRIDKTGNSIDIHDYKTGRPKSKASLNNDIQLVIYQIAMQEKYPDKNFLLNWHFLKEKTKNKQHIKIKKTSNEILTTINKISKTIKEIVENKNNQSNKISFSAKTSFLCNWCYLWEHCYAKKQYNEKNQALNIE